MPRSGGHTNSIRRREGSTRIERLSKWLQNAIQRSKDPTDAPAGLCIASALLVLEAVLCFAIIWRVPYTEIDWQAYMQQTSSFLEGERDYLDIRGGTGPLVYPAGFLYLFSALRWLTGGGSIPAAQAVFAAWYLCTQAVAMWLYVQSKVMPPWTLVLLCLSKRLHSIFLLRLFNDGPAMCIAYIALAFLVAHRFRLATVLFSLAVSVKMNVLLMAPSVAFVLVQGAGVQEFLIAAALGVLLQAALAAPFLRHAPASYVQKAFEVSRVFEHRWSLNLKFLPEHAFASPMLAAALLSAHMLLLTAFAYWRWTGNAVLLPCAGSTPPAGVGTLELRPAKQDRYSGLPVKNKKLTAAGITWVVLMGNFVGIICARTLHYQFYCWYFHGLPFLLWSTELHVWQRLALLCCLEYIWNVYPSTACSSVALQACHAVLLISLWHSRRTRKENPVID